MDDVNGTLTKYQNGPGIDNKLKLVTGTTSKYFLTDHLGSTNALTSSTGTILEQTSYDSFGNASNPSSASGKPDPKPPKTFYKRKVSSS
jgi:hypothetical protein